MRHGRNGRNIKWRRKIKWNNLHDWQCRQWLLSCCSSVNNFLVASKSVMRHFTALATQEAVWLCALLGELKLPQMLPTLIQEDNQGTIALSENLQSFSLQVEALLAKVTFHLRESIWSNDQNWVLRYRANDCYVRSWSVNSRLTGTIGSSREVRH